MSVLVSKMCVLLFWYPTDFSILRNPNNQRIKIQVIKLNTKDRLRFKETKQSKQDKNGTRHKIVFCQANDILYVLDIH